MKKYKKTRQKTGKKEVVILLVWRQRMLLTNPLLWDFNSVKRHFPNALIKKKKLYTIDVETLEEFNAIEKML